MISAGYNAVFGSVRMHTWPDQQHAAAAARTCHDKAAPKRNSELTAGLKRGNMPAMARCVERVKP